MSRCFLPQPLFCHDVYRDNINCLSTFLEEVLLYIKQQQSIQLFCGKQLVENIHSFRRAIRFHVKVFTCYYLSIQLSSEISPGQAFPDLPTCLNIFSPPLRPITLPYFLYSTYMLTTIGKFSFVFISQLDLCLSRVTPVFLASRMAPTHNWHSVTFEWKLYEAFWFTQITLKRKMHSVRHRFCFLNYALGKYDNTVSNIITSNI